MRALLFCLLPSMALAGLPPDMPDETRERPKIAAAAVPCLRGEDERRYVVRWVIVNRRTGERIEVGSAEVRRRC